MAKRSSFLTSRMPVLAGAVVVVVAALAAGIFVHPDAGKRATDQPQRQTAGTINYGPPTAADKQYSKERKAASTQPSPTAPTANPTTKKTVQVIITGWQQTNNNIEVSGFTNGIVEDGGTCTLTLARTGTSVHQAHASTANAQDTTCGTISIPVSSLASGSWKATLSYSSADATGTSSVVVIEVK